jgi:hypothetical protein
MSADDRRRDTGTKGAAGSHQLARVSAKAKIAEEIRYGLDHRDVLTASLMTAASSSIAQSQEPALPLSCAHIIVACTPPIFLFTVVGSSRM